VKVCCRELCSTTNPQTACDFIFPEFLGNGTEFRFTAESNDISDVIWRLHIPGSDSSITIGTGLQSDELDINALRQQYPSLDPSQICITILYRDAEGCFRLCCRCFCIEASPLECNDIDVLHYQSSSNLEYEFKIDQSDKSQIEWTLDNTNTFLDTTASVRLDFDDFGFSGGEQVYVSVRYFDENENCYQVCCKSVCLPLPSNSCDLLSFNGVQNGIAEVNFAGNQIVSWSLPDTSFLSSDNSLSINASDYMDSIIRVCVVYKEGDCCRLCCIEICLNESDVRCDDFEVMVDLDGSFSLNDQNDQNLLLSSTVQLPDGSIVDLGNDTNYQGASPGVYVFERSYLSACEDTIVCRKERCYSPELECEEITFEIDPVNDNQVRFTHNIPGGATYSRDFGTGDTNTTSEPTVEYEFPDSSAVYEVCLTVTDFCGDTCRQCVMIQIGQFSVSVTKEDETCPGKSDGSIQLQIRGGSGNVTINWDDIISPVLSRDSLSAGSYSVQIEDPSIGEDTTLIIEIGLQETIEATLFSINTTCGLSNGSITVNTAPDSVGSVFRLLPNGFENESGMFTNLGPDNYLVEIEYGDGCIYRDSTFILASQPLEVSLPDSIIACSGEEELMINESNANINWYRNGDEIASFRNEPILPLDSSGQYVVEVSNQTGNCTATDTVEVVILETDIILPRDTSVNFSGQEITLSVESADIVYWITSQVTLNCNACPEVTFNPTANTWLYIQAFNFDGCEVSDSILVEVKNVSLAPINLITPNQDGFNDILEIKGLDVFQYKRLIIFNKWGQLLYEEENYNNDWNGEINGQPLADGAYYYIIDYGDQSIDENRIKSDLTIIRKN